MWLIALTTSADMKEKCGRSGKGKLKLAERSGSGDREDRNEIETLTASLQG